MEKIMLLGAGELGKEVTIAAKRLGKVVIAVDRYENAPAMQLADFSEVIDMLDGDALAAIVEKHQPSYIVPEVEAIRTEKLAEFERSGICVVPTAEATFLTMNRDAIRDLAAKDLGIRTARYAYADSFEGFEKACQDIGFPAVVKPVMSSSGKGQSTVNSVEDIVSAWDVACSGMRGDKKRIIVEEFIRFESEITLLTVKQKNGPTLFLNPIGHRQERGDYQESWIPANIDKARLDEAKEMSKKVTDRLGGAGIFGVEFFITKDETIFSELSPRPHDTGMVTLIGQNLSEFELHVRAVLGLPIPGIEYYGHAASAVILADREMENPEFKGLEKALAIGRTDVRIFGKPSAHKFRRMGVALAVAGSEEEARANAKSAAASIEIMSES